MGFVAEHGSQLHPRSKPLEPVTPPQPPELPPASGPSVLDKIIDEDRLGFAEAQRADQARRASVVAKLRTRGRKPKGA